MKASEILSQYKNQNEDGLDANLMLKWLLTIENTIYNEIILTHEGSEEYIPEEGDYFDDFGVDKELIVQVPYDDLYIYYIDMRLYQMNKDSNNYNAAVTMFNNAYSTYYAWYNRTHKPNQTNPNFLRHRALK